MSRINCIDNVKAIAILLVILGYFPGLNNEIRAVVYSFHIPIFLFITGFLSSKVFSNLSNNNFNNYFGCTRGS